MFGASEVLSQAQCDVPGSAHPPAGPVGRAAPHMNLPNWAIKSAGVAVRSGTCSRSSACSSTNYPIWLNPRNVLAAKCVDLQPLQLLGGESFNEGHDPKTAPYQTFHAQRILVSRMTMIQVRQRYDHGLCEWVENTIHGKETCQSIDPTARKSRAP